MTHTDSAILGKRFSNKPLSELPKAQTEKLVRQLYSPEERFAQGFFRLKKQFLGQPEDVAWQNTLNELEIHIEKLLNKLDDPYMHTIGLEDAQGHYEPVGIYGFRPLRAHELGEKLFQKAEECGISEPGDEESLAIAHTYSTLNEYRNLQVLKYVFLLIAVEAFEKEYQSIFFFMSDHRLKEIYSRYGLEFPEGMVLPDTKHLVGYYQLNADKREMIIRHASRFGIPLPLKMVS